MTHMPYKELSEGLQRRLEERCEREGHLWELVSEEPPITACYWCHALSTESASRGLQ